MQAQGREALRLFLRRPAQTELPVDRPRPKRLPARGPGMDHIYKKRTVAIFINIATVLFL